jgi:glycosyltransferase involved in cell wall biosynthesis
MAVGTPAIVSDAGALPDTVGGVALLAGPDDADGWAAAIQSLDDPEVATDLGRRGREHAAGFTWARAGDAHVALYRQVLDGRMAGAAAWR